MQRLLTVLVLIAVVVVGLGFYQGWFQAKSDSSEGKADVTLSVNKDKFQEDKKAAEVEMRKAENKIKEKVNSNKGQ